MKKYSVFIVLMTLFLSAAALRAAGTHEFKAQNAEFKPSAKFIESSCIVKSGEIYG